jgi:hypothetical protein
MSSNHLSVPYAIPEAAHTMLDDKAEVSLLSNGDMILVQDTFNEADEHYVRFPAPVVAALRAFLNQDNVITILETK